ncbi:MAG: enoyl-CoA hydratase [Gordonia sp.]|nr:enoyl-CoA hydratase [Gordonia sp. (in: high G+C Gram-positive bacteria)]
MTVTGERSADNDAVADHLLQEVRGKSLWLTLNRPEKRNSLTVDLVGRLADAVEAADRGGVVRSIVISGSGSVFCAGGDLVSLSEVAEAGSRAVTDIIYAQFQRLVRALEASSLPVIAAVNGAALGAGLDLAMACDLRVVSDRAVFASSWIGVGLVPGMGGAHLLTRAVGSTRAAELVLLGRRIEAGVALDWGLVNSVVPDGELATTVRKITEALAASSQPAIASSKASLRRAGAADFAHELAILGAVQGGLLTGEEFRAATARFRIQS